MLALMLTGTYAWYSYSDARTKFKTFTTTDLLNVSYQTVSYISTVSAIPLSDDFANDSSQIETMSDKNIFTVDLKEADLKEQILVSISLVDVAIEDELKNANFKYDLLYNNEVIKSGNFLNAKTGEDFIIHDGVSLTSANNNKFELRIYILDDGSDQSEMMGKVFQGVISINVVSSTKAKIQ